MSTAPPAPAAPGWSPWRTVVVVRRGQPGRRHGLRGRPRDHRPVPRLARRLGARGRRRHRRRRGRRAGAAPGLRAARRPQRPLLVADDRRLRADRGLRAADGASRRSLGGAGLAFGATMVLLERTGKAVRSPSKSALLAHAARAVGRGRGFAVHKALDQVGAFAGPLLVAGVDRADRRTPGPGWPSLAVPGAVAMGLLLLIRARVPDMTRYDAAPPRGTRRRRPRSTRPPTAPAAARASTSSRSPARPARSGLMTFGIIGFHLVDDGPGARRPLVPVVYAVAMAVEAVSALATGFAYDRVGAAGAAGAAVPGGAGAAARAGRPAGLGAGRRRWCGARRSACRTPRSRRWWPTWCRRRGWRRRTACSRPSRARRPSRAARSPGWLYGGGRCATWWWWSRVCQAVSLVLLVGCSGGERLTAPAPARARRLAVAEGVDRASCTDGRPTRRRSAARRVRTRTIRIGTRSTKPMALAVNTVDERHLGMLLRWCGAGRTGCGDRLCACTGSPDVPSRRLVQTDRRTCRAHGARTSALPRLSAMPTLQDFSARGIDGAEVDLADYAGQVVLVVNTASQCGFTPQYQGLQELHDSYADRGFSVLRLPVRPVRRPGARGRRRDRRVLRAQLRRHLPAVRQGRGERRRRAPALPVAALGEGRPARQPDQVELHQVPRRPRRPGGRALRARPRSPRRSPPTSRRRWRR